MHLIMKLIILYCWLYDDRYESPYWRCFAATSIQVAWKYRM